MAEELKGQGGPHREVLDSIGGAVSEVPVNGGRTGFGGLEESRAGLRWGQEKVARVANEVGEGSNDFGRGEGLRRARKRNSVR